MDVLTFFHQRKTIQLHGSEKCSENGRANFFSLEKEKEKTYWYNMLVVLDREILKQVQDDIGLIFHDSLIFHNSLIFHDSLISHNR
jgi:hypothetical protein